MVKFHSNLLFLHLYMTVMLRAVARALIGGGGGCEYSYFCVMSDKFLLKSKLFQKKLVGHNTKI